MDGRSTYFELDGGVVVETVPAADPLALPSLSDHIEPVTINGKGGWHLTRDEDPEGTWHGLVWAPTPGTVVAVRGTTDYDTLLQAAQPLKVVDEDTWLNQVGPLAN